MEDDVRLAAAGGLLAMGALRDMTQRNGSEIDRDLSMYFGGLWHRMGKTRGNAADTTRLLLGVSLVVYFYGRRWQKNRKSDPADEVV
jgi:hypothetical protein